MKSVEEIAGFPAGNGLHSNTGRGIHDLIRLAMLEGFRIGLQAAIDNPEFLRTEKDLIELRDSKTPESFL